jgi:hypothetical protein
LDSANNFFFHIIHKSILHQSIFYKSLHFGTWDYGTITVPFRYRFPRSRGHIITSAGKDSSTVTVPSESSAALNLTLYFGRKWGHTRFFEDPSQSKNTFTVEAAFIMGPTLIPLSLANVDSSSKYVGIKNSYSYTGPANIIAWSFAGGAVLQWKSINFGLFGGLDVPLTGNTGWVYAYKPWIGFGIGVNLGVFTSGNAVN